MWGSKIPDLLHFISWILHFLDSSPTFRGYKESVRPYSGGPCLCCGGKKLKLVKFLGFSQWEVLHGSCAPLVLVKFKNGRERKMQKSFKIWKIAAEARHRNKKETRWKKWNERNKETKKHRRKIQRRRWSKKENERRRFWQFSLRKLSYLKMLLIQRMNSSLIYLLGRSAMT